MVNVGKHYGWAAGLWLCTLAALAGARLEFKQLLPAEAAVSDWFGYAVSIDGDVAVVGAPWDDNANGYNAGAAYVYHKSGESWMLRTVLLASDGSARDHFGTAVAVDGDRIAVSAAGDVYDTFLDGSVYVFDRSADNWSETVRLLPGEGLTGDDFGKSLALNGDTLVIGAPGDDGLRGAVHVFVESGGSWSVEAKLVSSDGLDQAQDFGRSISLEGDTLAVGSPKNNALHGGGAVYLFTRTAGSWSEQTTLTASAQAVDNHYGESVALDGGTLLIGAPVESVGGQRGVGRVYVYTGSGASWIEQAVLSSADGERNDYFGSAVDLEGDQVLIGAYGDDDQGNRAGSAYHFTRSGSGWAQADKLQGSSVGEGDRFGSRVGLSQGSLLVGAAFSDVAAQNSGCAYLFSEQGLLATDVHAVVVDEVAGTAAVDVVLTQAPTDPVRIEVRSSDINELTASTSQLTFTASDWSIPQRVTISGVDNEAVGDRFASVQLIVEDALSDDAFDGASDHRVQARIRDDDGMVETSKRLGASGQASDHFASALAVSGTLAVVGSAGEDTDGEDAGAAYVYTYAGGSWGSEVRLDPLDAGRAGDWFGRSIDISGTNLIVGAPGEDDAGLDSGAAYIFEEQGGSWVRQAKLKHSDSKAWDYFGRSVAIDGDTAVVGIFADDDRGTDSGSLEVFRKSGSEWLQEAKLITSDGRKHDWFARAVDIEGDVLVAGAFRHDTPAIDAGAVYVFERQGASWVETAKLTASDARAGDWFGASVSIHGNRILIGAPRHDGAGQDAGAAYLFVRNGEGWRELHRFEAPDALPGARFGSQLVLDANTVLVGAPTDNGSGNGSGAAYLIQSGAQGWEVAAKVIASDGHARSYLGQALGTAGDQIVVGAHGDSQQAGFAGAAYTYDFTVQVPIFDFADNDGDGFINSMEDFLGTNRDLAEHDPQLLRVRRIGGDWFFDYQQAHVGALNGTVEWSTDLENWQNTGLTLSTGTDLGAAAQMEARIADTGMNCMFFRLRLSAD